MRWKHLQKYVAMALCMFLLTGCACGSKEQEKSGETSTKAEVASDDESTDGTSSSEATTSEKVSDEETSDVETSDTATSSSDSVAESTTSKEQTTTTKNNSSSTKEEETTTKNNSSSNTGNTGNSGNTGNTGNSGSTTTNTGWNMTTAEVVHAMGIGINLGNTFESCGDWINSSSVSNYEKAWGSPIITKAMIQGIADEGFDSIRIPVAWSNMMGDNYTINSSYMARVKEVVDWSLDAGLYVIINIHYDGGWWTAFPTDKDECMKRYTTMWTQIATAFKDYNEKLIFESLNEEGCWDEVWNRWGGTTGKSEAYGLLNEINQKFVDLIRSSGGNNGKRHLLIAGYATDITLTCDSYFKMPTDSAGRCAVSVHYYTPSTYCILEEDASWGTAKTTWGDSSDVAELNKNMKLLYDTFVCNGVPVIIGEFGVPSMKNKDADNVILFLRSVAEKAYDYGMCPMLWDITHEYSYYNRYTCKMDKYPALKEAFADILK